MSLFTSLNVSLSGLKAASSQMQLVANNIANAGTEGYTTKRAVAQSAVLGGEGAGTNITSYSRATNDALSATLNTAISEDSLRSAQDDYLQQVQSLLGSASNNNPALSVAISDFAAAWRELAASPESNVSQNQAVQTASNLVAQIRSLSVSIESLDTQCHEDINATLTDLNANLAAIADLNNKISVLVVAGQDAGSLEDQRDQLVRKVAAVMNVTVMSNQQGKITLATPGGYVLVNGIASQTFSYDGTTVSANSNPGLSLNTTLIGGKLQALVNFRADTGVNPVSTDPAANVIQKLRDQLEEVVDAFTSATVVGQPTSFADAYASVATGAGEAASIFTGTAVATFAVNATLLDGTETIKVAAAAPVVDAFNASSRTFTADGLSVTNGSYETLATSILTVFQQAAANVAQLSSNAASQKDYLNERLTNETTVNVDAETVLLTTLQNAYAANAHVISILNSLFDILERI